MANNKSNIKSKLNSQVISESKKYLIKKSEPSLENKILNPVNIKSEIKSLLLLIRHYCCLNNWLIRSK